MIRYPKGRPPAQLTAQAATPGTTWDSLGSPERTPIREALVRDQAGLCAYCQHRIKADNDPATGRPQMKIEHWLPRADFPEHHLTWSNLLGVCLGGAHDGPEPRGNHALHCDASRGNLPLFLHPVDGQGPDPREHLSYTKNGRVEPRQPDARIDADIRALNLNAVRLTRARKAVFDALWEHLKRSDFATSALRRLARDHRLTPGTQARDHSELVRYHVLKKLRQRGETE
jgi:uncharacterized protein (TIGR02646 family)